MRFVWCLALVAATAGGAPTKPACTRPSSGFALECSGHGDWVVERARSERGAANWVALEMRLDRVYQTWAKSLLAGVDNLVVLGGKAQDMLALIKPESLSEIFVNFPDPPPPGNNPLVLLTKAFVEQMLTRLKPGGLLTIVTDDALYAARTEREIARAPSAADFCVRTRSQDALFSDKLPRDYGGSYFDSMWKNGNRMERFFLQIEKLNK